MHAHTQSYHSIFIAPVRKSVSERFAQVPCSLRGRQTQTSSFHAEHFIQSDIMPLVTSLLKQSLKERSLSDSGYYMT